MAGQAADAGHARKRAVLAVLLFDMGHVVMAETLINRVWGEEPPISVRNALYGYVAKLRAVMADLADPEVTLYRRQGGYLLRAEADQLDLHRLRAELALAAGRPAAAAVAMEDARQHATDLLEPLLAAQLEITAARRLCGAGQPAGAVALLTSARQRLSKLRAIPHLHACDHELAVAMAAARSPEPHARDLIDV